MLFRYQKPLIKNKIVPQNELECPPTNPLNLQFILPKRRQMNSLTTLVLFLLLTLMLASCGDTAESSASGETIVRQHRREHDDFIVTTTVSTLEPSYHQSTTPSATTFDQRSVSSTEADLRLPSIADSSDGLHGNSITGIPEIECGQGIVRFKVDTSKGKNASSVFVRGQSANPDCVFHDTKEVNIDLSKCNIRRKREINPSGVEYVMTVVVQLHPRFITKVDRAYKINCFYMEKPQDVSSSFNVSDISTHAIQMDAKIPNCTYSVHRDSPNGPLVKFTRVGEPLYHVWECKSKIYGMLLHNCQAVDGSGRDFSIIDENGCSKDEFLMPQITYTNDRNKAMAASAAFNFPDRNTMLFTCRIKLCYNSDSECHQITPPVCNGKRSKAVGENIISEGGTEAGTGESLVISNKELKTTNTSPIEHQHETEAVAKSSDRSTPAANSQEGLAIEAGNRQKQAQTSPTSTASSNEDWTVSSKSSQPQTDSRSSDLPADFPRPGFLLLNDGESSRAEGKNTATARHRDADHRNDDKLENKREKKHHRHNDGGEANEDEANEVNEEESHPIKPQPKLKTVEHDSWTTSTQLTTNMSPATETSTAAAITGERSSSSQEDDRYIGSTIAAALEMSTQPVKILKKSGDKHAKRDTTIKANSNRRRSGVGGGNTVDFDINSPELTIIDDYEPSASSAAQKSQPSLQREGPSGEIEQLVLRDDPVAFGGFESGQGSRGGTGNVCISGTALAVVGGLLILLAVIVIFTLIKATRRLSTISAMRQRSIYSVGSS